MSKALAAVSDKTIPAWKRVKDDDFMRIDWHTLRHAVRSLLSSRGHRAAVLGELLGQTNVATERRYDHAYQREALAVAADVAAMLSAATKAATAAQGGA